MSERRTRGPLRLLAVAAALCLAGSLDFASPAVAAPVPTAPAPAAPATTPTLSDSPAPEPCPANGPDNLPNDGDPGSWCLIRYPLSTDDGFDVPALGTYTLHVNGTTDTSVDISMPMDGSDIGGDSAGRSVVYTAYLRDTSTNARIAVGQVALHDDYCDFGAPTCRISFSHLNYPTLAAGAAAPAPVWIFFVGEYKCPQSTCPASFGATGEAGVKIVFDDPGAPTGEPTAAFTAIPITAHPGEFTFDSTSLDPVGGGLRYRWTFGDGDTSDAGAEITHTYTKPGSYTAALTVTDARNATSTVKHTVVVAAPDLSTTVEFVDSHGHSLPGVSPHVGDTVRLKLTLTASTGVGPISAIGFGGADPLVVAPAAAATIGTPKPAIPKTPTLQPDTSFSTTFPITVLTPGRATFTSKPSGKDAAGKAVTGGTAQNSYSVPGMKVTITLAPASFTMAEDGKDPRPVDVTVTEKITNLTEDPISHVVLRSLEPQRVDPGELMNVVYKSGAKPDPIDGLALADIPAKGSVTLTAVYTAKDDGKYDFVSVVTGADTSGATLTASGKARLQADPQHYLQVQSHVITPSSGLLPAGSPIVIGGTVTNLTGDGTITVPPLYAQLEGNAGLQSFTWNATGTDPKALAGADPIELKPGESHDFTLKVLTAYSEPVTGASPLTTKPASGGTQAVVTFTPWITVTRDDGTSFDTDSVDDTGHEAGDILALTTDLTHRIAIDDSIALPQADPTAVAGGIMVGTLQGVWNGASGMVTGLIKLPAVSASTLHAVVAYQDQVWSHFSEEQKQEFSQDSAQLIASVLYANYTDAKDGLPALVKRADTAVYQYLTAMENESKTGTYSDVVAKYTSYTTDALSQVMIPIALGKLATSADAAEVLQAAQASEDASAAEVAGALSNGVTVDEAYASVTRIPSGAQLSSSWVTRMYGITSTELGKLQALADKYNVLMVVRSRAASSIDWIRDFAAMLKPEAIKIKSVSALDVQLGYPASYEGALIFKEPLPLIQFRESGGDLAELTKAFVQQQGFTPGTAEYDNAIARMNDRIGEWNEWSATYFKWAKQRWINTSFNWRGNAMRDPNLKGSGRFPGFKMVPVEGEPETYVMQMYNPKTGTYVPITGDIDPIAFTHVDGSPLSREEHAALLNEMRLDPDLQSQHGESATYVNGGIKFIAKQFKSGEAGLMIGPGDSAPRAVRFNKDLSVWRSALDYHLSWDGGFVSTGANPASSAKLGVDLYAGEAAGAAALVETAQPLPDTGTTLQPAVGRCVVRYKDSATPTFMSGSGVLQAITASGLATSPLQDECLTDGPVLDVDVAPTTITAIPVEAGDDEIPIDPAAHYGQQSSGDDGFQVGQQVEIDPGSSSAETGTISSFGSIILAAPVRYSHPAGTVIVVVRAAERGTGSSTGSSASGGSAGGSAAGGTTTVTIGPGSLAETGTRAWPVHLEVGAGAIAAGAVLVAAGRRRRSRVRPAGR